MDILGDMGVSELSAKVFQKWTTSALCKYSIFFSWKYVDRCWTL